MIMVSGWSVLVALGLLLVELLLLLMMPLLMIIVWALLLLLLLWDRQGRNDGVPRHFFCMVLATRSLFTTTRYLFIPMLLYFRIIIITLAAGLSAATVTFIFAAPIMGRYLTRCGARLRLKGLLRLLLLGDLELLHVVLASSPYGRCCGWARHRDALDSTLP